MRDFVSMGILPDFSGVVNPEILGREFDIGYFIILAFQQKGRQQVHLSQFLDEAVRARPNAVSITPFSYSELAERIAAIRREFVAQGIGRGDRVVVSGYNHPTLMAVNILAAAIHAVCVPVTPPLIDATVARVRARALLTDFGLHLTGRPAVVEEACGPECMILFTSGTTGRPKGCELTHAALCASAAAWAAGMRLEPDDRCLCATPLAHGSYIANILGSLSVGAEVVCVNPRQLAGQVAFYKPTWLPVTPPIVDMLRGASLGRVRFARASKSGAEAAEAVLGVPVLGSYGMTECGSGPVTIGRHGSSVGRPVHLKVRIAATGFDCVSTDDVGEVEVNGPSLMLGYIDGPAHPIGVDGWMKTGDVGRFDSLGWLHLAGRLPGAG